MIKKSLIAAKKSSHFWSLLNKLTVSVLRFIVFIILTHLLVPEDFGIVSIVFVIVNLSDVLNQIGLSHALIQYQNVDSKHINTGFTISIIIGIITASLLFLLSNSIGSFFGNSDMAQAMKLSSPILLLNSLKSIPYALLIKYQKFKRITFIESYVFLFFNGFISIALAYYGYGFLSLIYSNIIYFFVLTVLFLLYSKHLYRIHFSISHFNDLKRFSTYQTIAKLGNFVSLQAENVIFGRMLDLNILGFYNRANRMITMPINVIGGGLNNSFFPSISKIQGNIKLVKAKYKQTILALFYMLLPLTLYIFIFSDPIVKTLLGPEWLFSAKIVSIIVFLIPLRTINKINDAFARALGKVYERSVIQWVNALVIIFSVILGVYIYGIYGGCFAIIFSSITNTILMSLLVKKAIRYEVNYKSKELKTAIIFLLIQVANVAVIYYLIDLVKINDIVLLVTGMLEIGILTTLLFIWSNYLNFRNKLFG